MSLRETPNMRFSYAMKLLVLASACSVAFTSAAEDQYDGRTLEEWMGSPKEAIAVFREAGTNSFPFLVQQLNGRNYGNHFAALMIIRDAFDRSQVENSVIETKLRAILVHGGQSEQIDAYATIRKLGLDVPASEIAAAASTCPSIKTSEYQAAEESKLPHLYSMTANSVDCDYIAALIVEPDPQIPMQTFGFLCQLERTNGTELCAGQIASAFAIMVTNNTDLSALRNAVAYIAIKPQRIHDNLDSITTLLEHASDESLLMSCESLLFALPRGETLPPRTSQALESLKARSATDTEVYREATNLLTNPSPTNNE